LSASAIVTYQKCPMMFYFSKVLGLDSDDDIDENIDARQFGNIFHSAICEIYKGFVGKTVTGDDIRALTDEFKMSKIDKAFIEEMFPKATAKRAKIESGECQLTKELNGNNRMVYNVICEYVKLQTNYDADTADKSPIEFIELEKEHNILLPVEIGGKRLKIKFGGFIDRIDHTNGETRVIDYKTGSNEVECKLLEDVFEPANIQDYKGILQTLIYCMMFDHDNPKHDVLVPYLFKTTKLGSGESFKVRSKGKGKGKNIETDDFADGNYMRVADRVRDFMQQTLTAIFDAETPFEQTEDESQCAHCNFSYLCNKQAKISYD
jgi:RecB family exonuclease